MALHEWKCHDAKVADNLITITSDNEADSVGIDVAKEERQ